jgi:hypothetical protein
MQVGLDRARISLKIKDEEAGNDRETQKKLPGSTAKSASQPDGGRHFEKENAALVSRRYNNCPVKRR